MTDLMEATAVPFVDFGAVHATMADDLRAAFERVLASGTFVGGDEVARFEHQLAAHLGVRHAVGVGSGTAALQLALVAAGIGPGDEVVIPANTFFATAEAVVAAGASPVLADVDEDTALLDADAAAAAITRRTAAIVMVHLYGQPADARRLAPLARARGLFVLEDAAQALGSALDGRPAGTLADAAAFSFYPSKNLGALGEAGAVTTDDTTLAKRIELLRSHGEGPRYVHRVAGLNERLDALQAAFLSVKLAHLEEDQAARDAAAGRYHGRLADLGPVRLLRETAGARHVHHLLVVRVPQRDRVLGSLRRGGIMAQVHYPAPIHLQPACPHLGRPGQFPVAERLAASVLSLPLFPRMTTAQVDGVCDALARSLEDA